jgi:CrcB protein
MDPDLVASVQSPERSRRRRADGVLVVSVGCGGALGALARYLVLLAVPTLTGRFPWGTFMINVSGSAVLGFLLVLVLEAFPRARLARPVIGTGIIGAYTTFSTFCVEAAQLFLAGYPGVAVAYLLASLAAGLVAAWLGMVSARLALRAERWMQEALE